MNLFQLGLGPISHKGHSNAKVLFLLIYFVDEQCETSHKAYVTGFNMPYQFCEIFVGCLCDMQHYSF
jgi:hypothetical protein